MKIYEVCKTYDAYQDPCGIDSAGLFKNFEDAQKIAENTANKYKKILITRYICENEEDPYDFVEEKVKSVDMENCVFIREREVN